MLGGPIQETVEILRALKNKNEYKIYALTNWSGELFPIALGMYDFLHWFDGRLVSGDEKMRKPFPEFYQLMIDRFELVPQQTVFIDDNLRNVKAAEQFGIQCIHFTSPQQLKENLEEKGVL
jgi:2-haloacid dehalogenase